MGHVIHPAAPLRRLPPGLHLLWLLAGAACTLPFCFNVMRNSDLWWHLATGRLIFAAGAIPAVDRWSFTRAGHPWLNHEWLAQTIFYAWVRGFGIAGLTIWFFGLLLLTAGLLQGALWRWTRRPLIGFLCTVWAMAVASPFFEFRPHLYSLLGVTLLLAWIMLLEAPDRWWLALVFLPWANLHAGVVLGLLIVGIWQLTWILAGDSSLTSRWPRLRRAASVFLACIVASLLNPQGVKLLIYPLKVARGTAGTFRQLLEFLPPFSDRGLRPVLYPWALGLFGAALLCLMCKRSIRAGDVRLWTLLAVAGLTLAMSLVSARFIPLFAIAQAPILAAALAAMNAAPAHCSRAPGARGSRLRWVLPALAVLAGVAALHRYPLRPDVFRVLTTEESFPVEILNFVERNRLAGNVFAYQGWGGYIHWRTSGRLWVYYDTRADTVFDPETYRRYVQVQYLQDGWMDTLEASGADYFLWPQHPWSQLPDVSQARALLASGRWRLLYSDFAAVLLARRSLVLPAKLAATPDSPYRRLALGTEAMAQGQAGEAQRYLELALQMDPRFLPACRNLAIVLAHTHRVQEALTMGRRCNEIFPDPATDAALTEELRPVRQRIGS